MGRFVLIIIMTVFMLIFIEGLNLLNSHPGFNHQYNFKKYNIQSFIKVKTTIKLGGYLTLKVLL